MPVVRAILATVPAAQRPSQRDAPWLASPLDGGNAALY
jgi:hypothetical protein